MATSRSYLYSKPMWHLTPTEFAMSVMEPEVTSESEAALRLYGLTLHRPSLIFQQQGLRCISYPLVNLSSYLKMHNSTEELLAESACFGKVIKTKSLTRVALLTNTIPMNYHICSPALDENWCGKVTQKIHQWFELKAIARHSHSHFTVFTVQFLSSAAHLAQ